MARKGINIRAGYDMKEFSKSSQNLIRSMRKTANKMKSVGRTMTTNLTAPIAALGGLSVTVFADFEQSMAKVAAVSGATGSELAKLTELSKDLGRSTKYTASQVAELQLNYAKLGFSTSEIENITEATLQLALATGEDLASSAEVAGGTLRSFGKDASQMQGVVDVMAKSFSSSALDLEKFKTGMGTIGAVANGLGQSLEETTAQLSVLSNNNIDASTAGTMLRNMMLKATKDGFSMSDALADIAQSTNKAETSLKYFDTRATATALILADNIDLTKDLTNQYINSGGAAKGMADVMDNTLQGSLHKVKSAIEGMAISFGETLAPTINKIAGFVSNLANRFTELDPSTKRTIVTIAAMTAAIGPLIFAIGSLTAALAFLAANPIVLVITGIIVALAALTAAFIYVKNNLDQFKTFFHNAFVKALNGAIDVIKAMGTAWVKLSDLLGLDIGQDFLSFMDGLKMKTKPVIKEFDTLVETVDKVKDKVTKGLGLDNVTNEVNGLSGGVAKLAKFTEKAIGGLKMKSIPINFTPKLPEVGVATFVDQSTLMAQQAAANIKQEFQSIGEEIADALNDGLKSLAANGAALMGEFIGNIISGSDMTVEDFGKGLLNSIGQFMSDFGKSMVAIGIAQTSIQASIASMNPALAIAGGIALIAAGTALSNISKAGIGGNPSGTTSPVGGGIVSNVINPQEIILTSNIELSGREMIITQQRENSFRR